MLVYRRSMRSPRLVLAVAGMVAIVVGCSGSDLPDTDERGTVVDTVSVPTSVVSVESDATSAEIEADSPSISPIRVDMTVELDSIEAPAEIGATVDPAALDQADPFGTFASCSGARRTFGPFSVMVSQTGGEEAAASVVTSESVTRTGIHDADVRVELGSGDVEIALGTVTIDDGWRSGTFVAFGVDGGGVTGSFECSGGDPSRAPLDPFDTVDVLDSVEVVALLRSDDAERVVGLAVQTVRSPEVSVECPASIGAGGSELVVRVDGDQTIGAISTFELTDGGGPTVRLRVGGANYEFADVAITLAEPATSGTFSAVEGGFAIDGAFRCT